MEVFSFKMGRAAGSDHGNDRGESKPALRIRMA